MAKSRKQKRNIDHIKGNWTVAELSVSYKPALKEKHSITSTDDAYKLIRKLWNDESICLQEQFAAFFFNRPYDLLGYRVISTGTMRECPVDIKLLVSLALHCMAEHVIIAHNHPSGNLNISERDKQITLKIRRALELIEVKLLDHFILSLTEYVSLAEAGYLQT